MLRVLFIAVILGLMPPAMAQDDPAPTPLGEENLNSDPEAKGSEGVAPKPGFDLESEAAQPAPLWPTSEPELPEFLPGYLDCRLLAADGHVCERINAARALLAPVELKTFGSYINRQRETALYREFAFAAFDEVGGSWHIVKLGMPLEVKSYAFQPFLLTAPDPTCTARRLRGISLSRMVVEIRCFGRELLVYGGKHLVVLSQEGGPLRANSQPRLETAIYLAPPTHLAQSEELARYGNRVLLSLIDQALERLALRGVQSRAYPNQLVAHVIGRELLQWFVIVEQEDTCFVPTRDPGCERFVPIPPYQTVEEVRRAIRVEVAIHGAESFRWAVSSSGARAAFQFMPSTYADIVRLYPAAKLEPDYRRGTADMINHAMAAALLNDANLADKKWTPAWARAAFQRDPRVGVSPLGGFYNGGPRRGHAVVQLMELLAKQLKKLPEALEFHDLLSDQFQRMVQGSGSGLMPETRGYILKLLGVVDGRK